MVASEDTWHKCTWPPSSHGTTPEKAVETMRLADGNTISIEDGGPLPFCPMCNEARMDPETKVFIKNFKSQLQAVQRPTTIEQAKVKGVKIAPGLEHVPPGFIQEEHREYPAPEIAGAVTDDAEEEADSELSDASYKLAYILTEEQQQEAKFDLDRAFAEGYQVAIQLDFENSNFARRYYTFAAIFIVAFLFSRASALHIHRTCPLEGAFSYPSSASSKFTPLSKLTELLWRAVDRIGP